MKLRQQEGNETFSQGALGTRSAHQAMAFEFIRPSQAGASVLVNSGWRWPPDRVRSTGCTSFSGNCC